MDEGFGGRGRQQADDEPDPHASDGAGHQSDEGEELGQLLQEGQSLGIPTAPGQVLIHDQEEATANGEVGHKDMEYGDGGHQHAVADGLVPEWILHREPPLRL